MGTFDHLIPPDHHAFAAFHERHLTSVSKYISLIGVRPSDTRDVTQLVFMKVYRHFDQVPSDEGVETWLFRICCQQAATYYGRSYRRHERPEPNVGVDVPGEDEQMLHERRERARLVGQVLEDMDPRLAEVLFRHEVLEQTLPVIADELHISRATAQRRLTEAKLKFERRMAPFLAPITPTNRRRLALLPLGLGAFFRAEYILPEDVGLHEGPVGERGLDQLSSEPTSASSSRGRATRATSEHPPRPGWTVMKPMLRRIFKAPMIWGITGTLAGAIGGFVARAFFAQDVPIHAERARPVVVAFALDTDQVRAGDAPGGPWVPASGATQAPVPASASPKGAQPSSKPRPTSDDRSLLDHAQLALGEGRFDDALAVLQQHKIEFPNSQFAALREESIARARAGLQAEKVQSGGAAIR